MKPSRTAYVCEAEGRSVYLYEDGTHRFDGFDTPLARCKFCNGFTSYTGTKQCNNCWEVSSRVRNMKDEVLQRILDARESQ